MLFPSAQLHLIFIGPQVSLPKPSVSQEAPQDSAPTDVRSKKEDSASLLPESKSEKPAYLPNVYTPPTPLPIPRLKRTRSSIELYGVPSYTVPYTPQLTITGLQANYADVHAQFQETFDPYCDLFFLFSPGFGFPSVSSSTDYDPEPLLQITSPTEWERV